MSVFDEEDFVLLELGAGSDRVVEHEAILEQHLIQRAVFRSHCM